MSNEPTSPDAELLGLLSEGYNAEILDSLLILRDFPYLKADGSIGLSVLACKVVTRDGKLTAEDHTFYFMGEKPHSSADIPINILANENAGFAIPTCGVAGFHLSSKPPEGVYATLLDKVHRYEELIAYPAKRVDDTMTPRTFKAERTVREPTPFVYEDTATARAGLSDLSHLFKGMRVGIIGLGGTGSYILDLVVKTPVEEIHLFDYDHFHQHNAFRTPGAASLETFKGSLTTKAQYLSATYSRIHRGIKAHELKVDGSHRDLLSSLAFVFVAVDAGSVRNEISSLLFSLELPFIDVGMGLEAVDDDGGKSRTISGICRVSTGTKEAESFFNMTAPFGEDGDELYRSNIQVADLNALNAALAVIRWKKHIGYYQDATHECLSAYTLEWNDIAKKSS